MANDDRAASPGAARWLAILALLLIVVFAGLGTWQVIRLQWKLDLIARVQSRVHAAPVAPPPAARWGAIDSESDEYRPVRLTGHYLYDLTTPVQGLTEDDSGYWLLTPLCTTDGQIILVNRGFIPSVLGAKTRYDARRAGANPCAAGGEQATVTGLLRISEPNGRFLRANDPAGERWYSRDVAAIAAARGLGKAGVAPVAPYFVDAAAGQNPAGSPDQPKGGLTVVSFRNTHLMYAATWYALALMVAGAWWWVRRHGLNRPGGAGNDEHED